MSKYGNFITINISFAKYKNDVVSKDVKSL